MTRTYQSLTRLQEFEIMKLLEANGVKNGPLYQYKIGWNDEVIADKFGCKTTMIAKRRRDAFGDLNHRRANTDPESKSRVAADIETLKTGAAAQRVEYHRLSQRLEALEKTINILLTAPVREGLSPERLRELKGHFERPRE